MLSAIFGFVLKNWQYFLVGAIALGGYAYWQSLLWQIDSLTDDLNDEKAKVVVLETKLKTCEANFTGVKNAIDAQNKAISSVNGILSKNAADWKKLVTSMQGQNDEISKRLAEIMKEDKPLTCEDAMKYLLDARKGYSK